MINTRATACTVRGGKGIQKRPIARGHLDQRSGDPRPEAKGGAGYGNETVITVMCAAPYRSQEIKKR